NKHPALFVHDSESRDRFSVLLDIHEDRCGWKIRIPQIVMDGLEIPLQLARFCIDSYDGVAEEIVSRPIAAPIVSRRRSERHVENGALLVERHVPTPDVYTRAILPAVVEPCFVPDFTGTGHRMKLPKLRACARVICARVAGISALRDFAHGGTEH